MSNCRGSNPEVKVIKVPVHDTITIEKERIVEHTKPIFVTDTLIKVDSVYAQDSTGTWVELPITWSQYKDTIKTDSTEAQLEIDYHGICAEIDRIHLDYKYNREIQIITKPPKKVGIVWFIGPSIGYGVHGSVNTGTFGHGPEIGITAGVGIGGQIEIKKRK